MCRCLANTCLLWVMAWLTVGCWIFPALFNQFACWNSCLGVRSSQISISKAFNKKTGKIRKACIQSSGFWGSHVRLANAAVLVFLCWFFFASLHCCHWVHQMQFQSRAKQVQHRSWALNLKNIPLHPWSLHNTAKYSPWPITIGRLTFHRLMLNFTWVLMSGICLTTWG